ncbi:hypothetical protein QUC31_012866 [Theobroma cacao]
MDQGAIESSFQAQAHLYKHMFNYIGSMSLKCAVQLGIPDIVHSHGESIALSELVSALQIHPAKTNCVYRLMRMLVHSGFFGTTKVHEHDQKEEAYVLTPSSKLLLTDKINCLSPFVLEVLDPISVNPFHFLGDWIKGDKNTAFEIAHSLSFWDYVDQNLEFKDLFHEAMARDSQMMNLVIKDYKLIFEGLSSLVDVGGGRGCIAKIISKAYPHLKCTVLDLPHVVANLPESENLNFIGGDMFQYIPSTDAILMKHILHDWSDEDCIKILKKCREAIVRNGAGGKVIIIDVVINEKNDKHELTEAKLFIDMLMMVTVNGRERNEKDFGKLFVEAGFTHYNIMPIFGLKSIMEVYP